MLFRHFFAVAFYSLWVMFTQPQAVLGPDEKLTYVVPGWEAYPYLLFKSLQVVRAVSFLFPSISRPFLTLLQFWTACVVFVPLMWSELRWW